MSGKFKLLFLSSDRYPPRRVDVSVLFAEKLAKASGHQIDFILQSEEDCHQVYHAEWKGCQVLVGKNDNRQKWYARIVKHFYSLLIDCRAVFRLRSGEYDFVQLKDKYLSSLFLVPACKIFRVKFIYWMSFPFPEESLLKARETEANYPLFYRMRGHVFDIIFYRFIVRTADFIFVQSEQMKHDLMARGVSADKQLVVPMGVSIENFSVSNLNIYPEIEYPKIVHLGTLARVRKMDFLIRVFSLVCLGCPNARLQMVGGGDEDRDMEILFAEAERLGIREKIYFTGWLPMDQALEYVKTASVCVSPFFPTPILNSTSPTKLVEYMAMGKAVVANDHPEQRLVIDESKAGICVPYDEQAFADAIVALLEDPLECRDMGRRGREYVEKYRTYDRIAEMVERQYLDLCARE